MGTLFCARPGSGLGLIPKARLGPALNPKTVPAQDKKFVPVQVRSTGPSQFFTSEKVETA